MLFFYTFALFLQFWLVSVTSLFVLLTSAFLALKPLPLFDWALILAMVPFMGTVALPTATFVAVVLLSQKLAEKGVHTFNLFFTRASRVTTAAVMVILIFITVLYGILVTDIGPRSRALFKHLVAQKIVEVVKNLPAGEQRSLGAFVCYKSGDHLLMVFNTTETEGMIWAQPIVEHNSLVFNNADLVLENSQWHAVLTALTANITFDGGEKTEKENVAPRKVLVGWAFAFILFFITISLWSLGRQQCYHVVVLLFFALTMALIHYAVLTFVMARCL